MASITLAFIVVLFFIAEGAAPQKLRPQCRSNVCDDRPECPRTSCRCLFPSRMDCSLYYQCMNGKPFQYRCSPGLLFNSETLTCDYSYNVNCTLSTTAEPSPSTGVSNTTSSIMKTTTETFTPSVTTTSNDELNNTTTSHLSTENGDTTTRYLSTSKEVTETQGKTTGLTNTPKAVTTNTPTTETETMSSFAESSSDLQTDETKSSEKLTTEITTIQTTNMPRSTGGTKKENLTTYETTVTPQKTTTDNSTTVETTDSVSTSESSAGELSTTTTVETTTRWMSAPTESSTTEDHAQSTTKIILDSTTESITTPEKLTTTYETTITETATKFIPTTTIILSTPREPGSYETTILETTTKSSPISTDEVTTRKELEPSESTRFNVTTTKQYSTEYEKSISTDVTTNIPPTKFVCTSRFGLFPDPRSCFRFYHCSHWVPYHKWCPSNLHFNPILKVCDWPYRAGCDNFSLTTTVTEEHTSTVHTNDTHHECNCEFCELPIPGDCSSYIMCIDKVARRMHCSAGLYFNPMTGTCDFQENVHCTSDDQCSESGRFLYQGSCSYFVECRNGNKTVRTCAEGLQFNASSEMCSWTGSCSGQLPDHNLEPKISVNISICEGCSYCFKLIQSDCSSYVRCTKDLATKERCAQGLYFNPRTELCDHDYNVDCPGPEPQLRCPDPFGYFPYPNECGRYVQCINGTAIVKSCSGVLHFDPKKKHCDWPWAAGCGDSNLTPTPEPSSETVNCDCNCCLKPMGKDCKSFILCINKVGFERTCSSGLLFNPQTENCDFAENVECTVAPPDIPIYSCPEYQGLFPHPEDCQKFIHCDHGVAHVKNCPSDLHFNPQLKVCDWPYSAGCQGYPTLQPAFEDDEVPCDLCESCFIPVGNDCASYIFCRNGTGYKLRCTESLLFNPKIEACDVASNVDCPNPPKTRCQKANGLFPAEECSQFIHCSNGIAYLKDCPDGLNFNAQTLVCDWPESAKCGDIPNDPTKSPDDIRNATIPDGVSNATKPDSGHEYNRTCDCDCCFLPNSNDCSKYFLCLDGYMHEGHCSRGLLFNPTIGNCDLAERVTCGSVSPLCPEPNGIFPSSNQCSSFLRCSSGTANVEYCPNGTHFSAQRKQCLEPCEAKCDSTYDCFTTSSSRGTISTTQPSVCLESDGFYPVVNDCSSFYSCSNGRPYLVKCPEGLHYSVEYEVCEYPCDAGCDPSLDCNSPSSSHSTVSYPTPSSSFPGSSSSFTISPHCPDEQDGLFPSKDDCSSFYQCSGGRAYLLKCPQNLHFSYEHQVCEHPCIAQCNSTIDCSSSTRQGTSSTVSPLSPECAEANGLFQNLNDCGSFYQCSNGKSHLIQCPSGLHFSLDDSACENPCFAGCDKNIDCSSSTKKGTPSTVSPISPECAVPNGLFQNPDDCSSFYQCSNGKSHLIQCPSGLHFSLDDSACQNPCFAGCDKNIDCTPTTPRTPSSTFSPYCLQPEGIYPVDGDCTAFYLCSNGKDYLIHCPPGLHYSKMHEICENPCVARCNSSIECISSTKQGSSSTISPLSPECAEADGLFPNPDDCSSFYQCSNGKSHLIQCPSGLHFSLDDAACENPCVAGCDISFVCPTEIPDTEGNCTCEDCYLPDPSDCSAFYFCAHGSLTKGYCPFGLLFDKISGICQEEDKVDCEANGDPIMCPEPFGFFPYPGECKKFLHCDNGIAHVKTCSENLEYDPVNKVCTKPKGYCGDTSRDPHCLEPTGLFPDSTNCRLFYHCEHGVAYQKHCSSPLMFNPAKGVCDWPENVECGKDSTIRQSTASSTSTESQLSTKNSTQSLLTISTYSPVSTTSEPCHEVPGVICPCACRVPTYDECSSFFQCQEDGTACKKYCPEGLYFNKIEMVCDLPTNVECRDFFFATLKRAKYLNQHAQSSAKSN